MVLLQMLVMVLAVTVINEEIDEGTLTELFQTAGNRVSAVMFGKALAHTAIHTATGLGVLGLLFPLFGITIKGSILLAVPFMIFFIAAGFFPGFLVSCLVRNKFIATDIAAFYNSPAFLFSGYTFPLWAMPSLHYYYAQLLPFTHFLTGFLKIYRYNAPVMDLMPQLAALSIFVFIPMVIAALALKYRIKPLALTGKATPEAIR